MNWHWQFGTRKSSKFAVPVPKIDPLGLKSWPAVLKTGLKGQILGPVNPLFGTWRSCTLSVPLKFPAKSQPPEVSAASTSVATVSFSSLSPTNSIPSARIDEVADQTRGKIGKTAFVQVVRHVVTAEGCQMPIDRVAERTAAVASLCPQAIDMVSCKGDCIWRRTQLAVCLT